MLTELPTLSPSDQIGELEWELLDAAGEARTVKHTPRMTCGDFGALRDAAAAGLGVAFLPDHACRDLLEAGRLVRVFPNWSSRVGIVHAVFTTRRGLPPAVRSLIDQLVEAFKRDGLTE
jgi:DNA-binding transcriptional LysR family regulator